MSEVLSAEAKTKEAKTNGNVAEFTREKVTFSPLVDIWEDQHEIVLIADMPGVDENHLDIEFENRQLTIEGRVERRHPELTFLGGEYETGDFHRTFTIGDAIDAGRISAELKSGVLTVHLPKVEAVKPRKIPIRTE